MFSEVDNVEHARLKVRGYLIYIKTTDVEEIFAYLLGISGLSCDTTRSLAFKRWSLIWTSSSAISVNTFRSASSTPESPAILVIG